MPRTTPTLVSEIIEVDSVIGLTPFIAAANVLVTRVCASATKTDGSAYYVEDDLTLIETWLAAHFYCMRDTRVASESAGPVSASYQHQVGLILKASMYGQQAMLLDSAGGLAALSKQMENGTATRVGVLFVGGSKCVVQTPCP